MAGPGQAGSQDRQLQSRIFLSAAGSRATDIETRDYAVFNLYPEAAAKLKPGARITGAAHGHNGLGGQVLDVGLVKLK